MTTATYVALYAGFLIFLIGCIRRVIQYSRVPRHLRWELYPVPHEERHRAAHGGSYFEASDWWIQPEHFNLFGELRAMLSEILFLKALWEHNRRLWYSSYLFHLGLYSWIATCFLVALRAVAGLISTTAATSTMIAIVVRLYHITGLAGAALIMIGALGLLVRRLVKRELREYTTAADVFNLGFFVVTVGFLLSGYLLLPNGASVTGIARGALTFDTSQLVGAVFGTGLILASILVAYIPYTHMSHFIAKYFTYHAVRWDDQQNLRGGSLEREVNEYLGYRPTWAAAHMHADGKKTWAEVAMINPAQEDRK